MRTFVLLIFAAVAVGSLWFFVNRQTSSTVAQGKPTKSSNARPDPPSVLELNIQARKNLGLSVAAARAQEYWRTVSIPGIVQDRPGVSDRGVTSPAVGSVSAIHKFEGETVEPGDRLVTIQLFSEYLQATQTQLFKAAKELEISQSEIERLSGVASAGGVSKSKVIQLRNEAARQEALIASARQELLNRGLNPDQVDQTQEGQFVSSIDVVAPPKIEPGTAPNNTAWTVQSNSNPQDKGDNESSVSYELQTLSVELGQSVQAGQLLVSLADHSELYVVGHAFKHESDLLQQCAQQGRALDIEFGDDDKSQWRDSDQIFRIRHLSNTIDPQSRTLDFFIPLSNQSRSFNTDDETFLVWRYRPGQRTRIHVPLEKFENVFVLPTEGVAFEGAEAFVYRQNGDLFKQISVQILYKDRRQVVIAGDGSIAPGSYLAQNSGSSLRRILKAQSDSGRRPGFHVHADGSVHEAH
ncbi:MAG: MchE protein [Planctomycetota bacterium]